jgi:hypothetical protein
MAVELVDRLAILVAFRRFPGMVLLALDPCALTGMSVCKISFVELLMILFGVFGDVRREFMQRLSAALHGTLGSYLRDAFDEGSADAVACLSIPRAKVFPSFLLSAWWLMLLFCKKTFNSFRINIPFYIFLRLVVHEKSQVHSASCNHLNGARLQILYQGNAEVGRDKVMRGCTDVRSATSWEVQ